MREEIICRNCAQTMEVENLDWVSKDVICPRCSRVYSVCLTESIVTEITDTTTGVVTYQ